MRPASPGSSARSCSNRTTIDGGLGVRAAATIFRVSVSYIDKAPIRRRRTGEASANTRRGHRARKLTAEQEAALAACGSCRCPAPAPRSACRRCEGPAPPSPGGRSARPAAPPTRRHSRPSRPAWRARSRRLAQEDRRLAVKRQPIEILANHHIGDKAGTRLTLLDRQVGRRCLPISVRRPGNSASVGYGGSTSNGPGPSPGPR